MYPTLHALGRPIRPVALGLATLAAVLQPSPASASPLLELLGGTLGTGGFNARATGASAASAYFNPALLPKAEAGLEVGLVVLNDAISIGLDGRSSDVDVALTTVNQIRAEDKLYPVPTSWLEEGCTAGSEFGLCRTDIPATPRQRNGSSGNTHAYAAIGYVTQIVDERWAMGFYSVVPVNSLLSAHAFHPDESEQYFTNSLHAELYADRLTPMSLAFGTGVQATDWLSFGLSLTLNLTNDAVAMAYVGDSNILDDTLLLSTEVESSIGVAPHFAVLVEPIEALSVSMTVHTTQRLDITADSGTYLASGDQQRAVRTNVQYWVPTTVALAPAYEVFVHGPHSVTAAATLMFRRWSRYLNRHGDRPLPGYEWYDTLAGSLGGRYAFERLVTFVDLTYEPSPVPPQTGRTNYVDNDRFGATAGLTYTLPILDGGMSLRFGAQGQLHLLRERHQTKIDPRSDRGNQSLVIDEWPDDLVDPITGEASPEGRGLQTNNPGWPGFRSSGTLVAASLSIGLLY